MMENISPHITYKEATRSRTASRYGIDNKPDPTQLEAMKTWADKIFEPMRKHFGVPIFVSSFFRSKALNKKLRGSKTSAHMRGEAGDTDDVISGEVTNADMFYFIKDNLDFDQLIWEFGSDINPDWVHSSYRSEWENRNQVLKAVRFTDRGGRRRVRYEKWPD